jgi:hypothetical protein
LRKTDRMTADCELRFQAACLLADAVAMHSTLHESGQRERYRLLLHAAIDRSERALAAAGPDDVATLAAVRSTLAAAHAAKAEDALHGAGQLSLSAQRAPTREACDDGWGRVEAIVLGAEAAARGAAVVADELEQQPFAVKIARRARKAAARADAAARAARAIVEARNHAYTFHTDGGFSFGEGWYLAAGAVLEGVFIQIEPGKDGTPAAERFLRDAGLASQLRPYRPRPRAMKHVTEIVGGAFRADPAAAQGRLRSAFLGEGPCSTAVTEWVDRKLEGAPPGRKVLLWIRDGAHHPARNTRRDELIELTRLVESLDLVPVLTGDALRDGRVPEGAVDLILFWQDAIFRQEDRRRAQLQFFEHLRSRHGLVGQLGVTTAGMDGPALMGLPTIYLTDEPNVRMRAWVGAVPAYREVIRTNGYLEQVARVLREWSPAPPV